MIELLVSWCLISRMDIRIVQSVCRMAGRFGGTVSYKESMLLFCLPWYGNREGGTRERKKYLGHFAS